MRALKKTFVSILTVAATLGSAANAALIVTEVQPSASGGNTPYNADWFELTNNGVGSVSLSGYSMDDDSNTSGVAPLRGITSIGAGQSVVFIDNGTNPAADAAMDSAFRTAWGNPVGLLIGFYGGSGIGLGTGGDQVNIFNGTTRVANVVFGAADSTSPFNTFDNAAGINGSISQQSALGVNGAFLAPGRSGSQGEIGSPGVAPVPLPAAAWLLLSGVGALGAMARRRKAMA